MDPALQQPEAWHRRITRQSGVAMLTAGDERFARIPAERFARAWAWVLGLSLLWGLATVGLWELAAVTVTSSTGGPVASALAVAAPTALWVYRRGLRSLVGLLGAGEALGGAVLVLVWFGLLVELPGWSSDFGGRLPAGLQWFRPPPHYRVLLLSPVWGAWSMLIVPQFCRPTERTAPQVARFAGGCGPATAAFAMALPLAASLYYFNHLSWWQPSISIAAITAATGGGALLCRLGGGLKRSNLLAANVLTQLVFLAAYLVNR